MNKSPIKIVLLGKIIWMSDVKTVSIPDLTLPACKGKRLGVSNNRDFIVLRPDSLLPYTAWEL